MYSLGMQRIVISTIKPAGRALENSNLLIEPTAVPLVALRIATIARSKNISLVSYPERGWPNFGCPASYSKLGITATGRVTPCVFLGSNFQGESVLDNNLSELWERDVMINKLRKLSANSSCRECSIFTTCNGGCRARGLFYGSDIESCDPYQCQLKEAGFIHGDNGSSINCSAN
jgi:radical SAM protein with 4Fe4S-binding SPASM domain